MATIGTYRAESAVAGEAISQWHFVTLESDGFVDMADADAEKIFGVALTSASAAGEAVTVALSGRVKVEANGTIAAGAEVVTDANGKAVTKADSSSTTAVTAGIALESAVDGQIFTIELVQTGWISDES